MSQHFLLSRQAKTLSLATVFRMSDAEAEAAFKRVRWAETNGEPVCPKCGGLDAYEFRRETGALVFQCRACKAQFSITSGTLFASHKLPLRMYLAAIAIFCNEVKGKSMLAMSRDLGLSYKAAFVLGHKMREAMAAEMKGRTLGGEAKTAEVDGAYFGGYVKPANLLENRKDRRLAENQTGKRKVVVIIRERGGDSLPAVFQVRSGGAGFYPLARQAGNGRQRRRSLLVGQPARQVRDEAHQPQRGILAGRRVHELGRRILLPASPRRGRPPPPYRWPLPSPLRSRGRVARG